MFNSETFRSLNQIKKFYFANRRMPTYREMIKLLGVSSTGTVAYMVNKWIEAGIFSLEGKSLIPAAKFFEIPLLGSIRAGNPSEDEEFFDTYSLRSLLFQNPDGTYALKVVGDSMVEAGILEGDLVVLDKHKTPREGDVVAAYIDEAWTLKYFMKKKGQAYLKAANPKYQDFIPTRQLEIGGVVVSVIRSYATK